MASEESSYSDGTGGNSDKENHRIKTLEQPDPDHPDLDQTDLEQSDPEQTDPEDDEVRTPRPDGLCPVVGIGASAGGLEAVTQILKDLSPSTGMAFVLITHLEPNHESMLVHLLTRQTAMPVSQATQGATVAANHIYIIPPNTQMSIENGVLVLTPRDSGRSPHLPIDYFLSSLAEDQKSRAIGVILSGAASDGTLGLEAIKAEGGITFAQDDTASFDSMPHNAISAGVVDFVLPPGAIARELATVADHLRSSDAGSGMAVEDGPALQRILLLLRSRSGVNFSRYKLSTLRRRLARRVTISHCQSLDEYLELLEKRSAELDALFDDVLITVTQFFRNPPAFEALTKEVFPALTKNRRADDPIRVWVAGCSTGQEVYSLAISLLEYLETAKRSFPIQIFGTDVSERAVEKARQGKYPPNIEANVGSQQLARFFNKLENGYQIGRAVREVCVFSRQDVTRDPPLSRMDLVSCRNVLIYLGKVLQRRVLSVFSYALQPHGYLWLGDSESVGSLTGYFVAADAKNKIYTKNLHLAPARFESMSFIPPATGFLTNKPTSKVDDAAFFDIRADQVVIDRYAPGGLLIDAKFRVIKFRGPVRPYLANLAGKGDLDLFQLIKPELVSPLGELLESARNSDGPLRRERVPFDSDEGSGKARTINLIVHPLNDHSLERHFLILFEEEAPMQSAIQTPEIFPGNLAHLSRENQDLALELVATRTYMQRLVEELRSANEEAQSNNEELQSTNEEVQTAKEELESSNEELITTNEEMESRNRELGQLNDDLVNLLSSMQAPIIMLDSELRIRRYTPTAEQVLNLIPTDIGRSISDLQPRINVPDLETLLNGVVRSVQPLEREVEDQAGRWHSLRIHPYRTSHGRVEGAVLQLMDIDQIKKASEKFEEARDYAKTVIETVREPLLVLDEQFTVQTANRAFFDAFSLSSAATIGRPFYELDGKQWDLPAVHGLLESVSADSAFATMEIEVEQNFKQLGWRTFQVYARRFHRGGSALILLALEDIGDRKKTAEAKYRRLFEAAKDAIIIVEAETGKITDVNPYTLQLLGYAKEDFLGKPFWQTEPLKHIPEEASKSLDRVLKEEVVRFSDVPLRARDGRQVDVEMVGNVYKEGEKQVIQFNIRDITARKQFDQQLRQTARLESLGILAGGIAHDFNNLLAGILGNASLALSDAAPGSAAQSALKDVVRASQRAADLTRQMLTYAGKGRSHMHAVDFSESVHDIINLVRSSISKNITVEMDLAEDLPAINADESQIQQVIMNLVINGAEAIGERNSGSLRVATRVEHLSRQNDRRNVDKGFSALALTPGDYVVLQVTDTGCGMDEETRAKIFDPFFTTKFSGRGLGLAAVQGIITGHKGAMQVESTPGKGTTFKVYLPAAGAVRAKAAPEAEKEIRNLRGLVLVVDDEDLVLRTTRAILERHGCQVVTATNGKLAVEKVQEKRSELSLVILDLTMPVMGGEEALSLIKQLAPELPVILSSGYDAGEAAQRFTKEAVAGFIQKPATIPDFLKIVNSALR